MNTLSRPAENSSTVNVLLVEDDAMNQFIAKTFLSKWGFQVVVANNGQEAVEQIKSRTFSIVLMDIHMPVMDGGEAASRIRAMEDQYFKSVPILAFSAVVVTKENAIAMGMTDYANKPINPSELKSKISQYVLAPMVDTSQSRKLNIDFNVYTDGDDEFKNELTSLMINNLNELEKSVNQVFETGGNEAFHRTIHKVKPTLGMLNDSEMTEIIDLLKVVDHHDEAFEELKKQFLSLNQQVIDALEKELKTVAQPVAPAKAA
jgi:CheY-like chemotaxis protein